MKFKEMQGMKEEEINSKVVELKKELVKLHTQVATGTSPKSPGQIRKNKRTIAKLLTALRQRKGDSNK